MAENSKEQMDEAIARAKKEVADEVQDHKAEEKVLDEVVGGLDQLWKISVTYVT